MTPAHAQSVEEFYKGKTITSRSASRPAAATTSTPGISPATWASTSPASPTIVPQNMAGAGSLRAANFIYSAAPKDGTAFGTFARTTGINPLLESGATFDGTKFTWLGSVTDDICACVTWHTSQAKTWEDFLKKPITLGGQGPSSEPDIFANLYKNVFGAPIKLVAGYPGTNEITLAMERGEVDGLCGLSWSTIKTRHAPWLKDKKINLLVQAAFKKEPEIGDVPLVMDLTKDTEKLQILKLILAAQEMARPFAAPPGIPADRKAALIAAFDATMKDPEYLADAKKSRIDVNPVTRPRDRQAARGALRHAQGRDRRRPARRSRDQRPEVASDGSGMASADRTAARQPRRGPAAAARRAPLHRRHRRAGHAACRLRAQPAPACRSSAASTRTRRWRCPACMRCSRSTISRRSWPSAA